MFFFPSQSSALVRHLHGFQENEGNFSNGSIFCYDTRN